MNPQPFSDFGFDSLKEILEKSPGTRIFVIGRPHIRTEIKTRLAERVTTISLGPIRPSEDGTPDAMDHNLKAEILEKIPGSISEM